METPRWNTAIALCLTLCSPCALASQAPQEATGEPWATAEGVVTELYDLVTFDAGTTPDWDKVKSLFLDEAIVVLRTSRTESTQFTLEGFVQDFVNFIERDNVVETGFVEKIIKLEPMVFRDIAHVLVLYEAQIPGRDRPPTLGVDSFQLIRKNDRWWIVSITNDLPSPDHPVPAPLRNR
jgi:hypothetical protein